MARTFEASTDAGPRSRAWFERACELLPGGVNSPVRSFRAVGGTPPFIERGEGAYVVDVDGRRYLDYILSWGALLLGHAAPEVRDALVDQIAYGTSYGLPTPPEVELAETIRQFFPSLERLRFTVSGTEATMSAVRLARAATQRPLLLKFEGCYHGHADTFLVRAGSGVATLGLPDSPGVPPELSALTRVVPFNDLDAVEDEFRRHGDRIAAVIVEPVVGNAGLILPEPGFLEGLRRLTENAGALLIFDEVMTGFRVAPGGAQERFRIRPDLTTLGKVIGAGLPIGAFGGRRDLMERVAPLGPVYQAGTLAGNPLAMRAGLAQLEALRRRWPFAELEARAQRIAQGLASIAAQRGRPLVTAAIGSMWGLFFRAEPVRSFADARASDTAAFRRFFHGLRRRGVLLPPSPFEAAFLSTAHTDADIDATLAAADEALAELDR